MLEEYLKALFCQYCNAREIKNINFAEMKDNEDFINWIVQNRQTSKMYKDYLSYLNVSLYDGTEAGKGKYDSISSKDMKIVSSYGITLGVLPSKLIITDRNVLIATPRTISLVETNLFITHNLYSYQDVSSWHKIHNSGMYDISIGMYGNIYDRDRKSKIELLSKLADKMDTDTELTQDTLGDKYFCSLNSRRYIKRKILTR